MTSLSIERSESTITVEWTRPAGPLRRKAVVGLILLAAAIYVAVPLFLGRPGPLAKRLSDVAADPLAIVLCTVASVETGGLLFRFSRGTGHGLVRLDRHSLHLDPGAGSMPADARRADFYDVLRTGSRLKIRLHVHRAEKWIFPEMFLVGLLFPSLLEYRPVRLMFDSLEDAEEVLGLLRQWRAGILFR